MFYDCMFFAIEWPESKVFLDVEEENLPEIRIIKALNDPDWVKGGIDSVYTNAGGTFFENIKWLAAELGKDSALKVLMNNDLQRELAEGPNKLRDKRERLMKLPNMMSLPQIKKTTKKNKKSA